MGRRASGGRRALGEDPFEAVIPGRAGGAPQEEEDPTDRPAAGRPATGKPAPAEKGRKTRATFHLPVDLLEEARDVVYWVPGLTMANLTEEALRREIRRIKDVRNDGDDFPGREGDIKRGRPVS